MAVPLLLLRNRYKEMAVVARAAFPTGEATEGGAMVKKVIIGLLVAFAVYSVIATPKESAEAVRTAGTALQTAGKSVIDFFQGLNSE